MLGRGRPTSNIFGAKAHASILKGAFSTFYKIQLHKNWSECLDLRPDVDVKSTSCPSIRKNSPRVTRRILAEYPIHLRAQTISISRWGTNNRAYNFAPFRFVPFRFDRSASIAIVSLRLVNGFRLKIFSPLERRLRFSHKTSSTYSAWSRNWGWRSKPLTTTFFIGRWKNVSSTAFLPIFLSNCEVEISSTLVFL